MWTKAFWLALAERAIRAGAAAVVSVFVVGDVALNALTMDWLRAVGICLGGALFSALSSLAAGVIQPGTGPSFGAELPAGEVAAMETPDGTVAGPASPLVTGTPVDVDAAWDGTVYSSGEEDCD